MAVLAPSPSARVNTANGSKPRAAPHATQGAPRILDELLQEIHMNMTTMTPGSFTLLLAPEGEHRVQPASPARR